MAVALDPKQIVSYEELFMPQVFQQEALTRVAYRGGDIHEGRVSGDGGGVNF